MEIWAEWKKWAMLLRLFYVFVVKNPLPLSYPLSFSPASLPGPQGPVSPQISSSSVTSGSATLAAATITPSPGDVLAAALTGKGKDTADDDQGLAKWFGQGGVPAPAFMPGTIKTSQVLLNL